VELDSEDIGDEPNDAMAVPYRSEIDEPDAVGMVFNPVAAHLEDESGLSDASGSR
jgi:hypothetical protein